MKYSEGKEYKSIAVCMAKFDNDEQIQFITNFHRACKRLHYKLFVFSSMIDFYNEDFFENNEKQIFELMDPKKFDAVVIMSLSFKRMNLPEDIAKRVVEADVPCITIGYPIDGCVTIAHEFGTYFEQVVRHIIEFHGAKKVNFIAGMKGNSFSEERLEIYRNVLTEKGIPIEEERIGYGNFWEGPTAEVMDWFLKSGQEIDAIICANDLMAMEACRKLAEAGYRVPEDVIVSGFDGVETEKFHYPRICTSATDNIALAAKIVEIIERLINNNAVAKEYLIGCKMQPNQSCGCVVPVATNAAMAKLANQYFHGHMHERGLVEFIESMYVKVPNLGNKGKLTEIWGDLHYFVRTYIGGQFFLCFNSDFLDENMEIWPNVTPMELQGGTHYYTDKIRIPFSFRGSMAIDRFTIDKEELMPAFDEIMEGDYVSMFVPLRVQASTVGYVAECFKPDSFDFFRLHSFCMNISNIIEAHKYRIDYQNLYSTDQLTKLLNRKGFYLHMESHVEMAIREQKEVALISIDMNWLKQINDNFGHKEGDFALEKIGEILENAVGEGGVCTRFGGDEFAVAFADEAAGARAEAIMEKIKKDIDEFNAKGIKPYPISVSMGCVAYVPDSSRTIESYIVEADRQMYQDKARFKATHIWEGKPIE
ncbi:MAG: GGDEF domain-containing protein [Lachnospiraceae bacterium]|nr:GGDEF domain-containing protein [Lachnospiraceae bacterium]